MERVLRFCNSGNNKRRRVLPLNLSLFRNSISSPVTSTAHRLVPKEFFQPGSSSFEQVLFDKLKSLCVTRNKVCDSKRFPSKRCEIDIQDSISGSGRKRSSRQKR